MRIVFLWVILIFSFSFSAPDGMEYLKKNRVETDRETFKYIYSWIYRIANTEYFNKEYFKESLFKQGKGVFIFKMSCVKDYSGEFFLEIPKVKYINRNKYKYRYIPISKVDKNFCKKPGEIYTFVVFEDLKDKVFDVKTMRECYLSSLKTCIKGRKNICMDLDKPSFTCIRKSK